MHTIVHPVIAGAYSKDFVAGSRAMMGEGEKRQEFPGVAVPLHLMMLSFQPRVEGGNPVREDGKGTH